MYQKLSDKEEIVGREIVDIAISIHKQLGPGLLESVYAKCFYHELACRNICFERERLVPIWYNDFKIDEGWIAWLKMW